MEEAIAPPNFDVDFTVENLAALSLQLLDYPELIDLEAFRRFESRFLERFDLDPQTLYKVPSAQGDVNVAEFNAKFASAISKMSEYLIFERAFSGIIDSLESQFSSNYNLYLSQGTAGIPAQILPLDESFLRNVLGREEKHLFLIFDLASTGFGTYTKLMNTKKNAGEANREFQRYIEDFLGAPVQYTKLSDRVFEYKVLREGSNPREVRFVFFDSLFEAIHLNSIRPLLRNATRKFLFCGISAICEAHFLFGEPAMVNAFDYFISTQYSKNPYYTREQSYMEKIAQYKIINLRELRNHLNKPLVKKVTLPLNAEKLVQYKIPFKFKGDPTFWNFVRGGKQRKTKRRKSKQRKTRKSL